MKRNLVGPAVILAVLVALPATMVLKSYSTHDGFRRLIRSDKTVQRRFSCRNLQSFAAARRELPRAGEMEFGD